MHVIANVFLTRFVQESELKSQPSSARAEICHVIGPLEHVAQMTILFLLFVLLLFSKPKTKAKK